MGTQARAPTRLSLWTDTNNKIKLLHYYMECRAEAIRGQDQTRLNMLFIPTLPLKAELSAMRRILSTTDSQNTEHC